jgi:hypothetical protein
MKKISDKSCTVNRNTLFMFYIRSFVHRNPRLKKSNEMQKYGNIYLLLNYCTCFGRPSRPSSGVHKTVVRASGTDHTIWRASFFKRDQIRTQSLFGHAGRYSTLLKHGKQINEYCILSLHLLQIRILFQNFQVFSPYTELSNNFPLWKQFLFRC